MQRAVKRFKKQVASVAGAQREEFGRGRSAGRRVRTAIQLFVFVVGATLFAFEVPGRVLYLRVRRAPATMALGGAFPESLKAELEHDFLDEATRIHYDFDMFMGWRARPNQRGFTYATNPQGRRDDRDYRAIHENVVFLTGGSVAWSCGATSNAHTIAAELEHQLNTTEAAKGSVSVLNLAEQAYGLRQEMIGVLDEVSRLRPRAVVFLDGANDLATIRAGKDPRRYRVWGAFADILEESLREATGGPVLLITEPEVINWSMTVRAIDMARLAAGWKEAPRGMGLRDAERQEIEQFFSEQIREIHDLLRGLGIPAVFALQPVGYLRKPLHERERFIEMDPERQWWAAAYAVVEGEYERLAVEEGVAVVNLVGVFANEFRQTYIDVFHLNDRGNKLIAEALAGAVEKVMVSGSITN